MRPPFDSPETALTHILVVSDPARSKAMFSDIARGDTSGLAKYAK